MIDAELVFIVDGKPAPKGSLRCVGKDGRHQLVEDNARTKPWRAAVAAEAPLILGRADDRQPIGVEITSTFARPADHYGTGRNAAVLKDSAPPSPTNRHTADVDKLARLVLDALVDARLIVDDSQVVEVVSRKAWARSGTPDALDHPGAIIRVYPYGR